MIFYKASASLLLLSTFLTAPLAVAQQYPNKPIRVIVGYPAGATDTAARTVARPLSTRLNVPVIVENKPGGSGTLAATFVQLAAPDGYTLLHAPTGTFTLRVHLYKSLNYEPLNFSPISNLMTTSAVLVVAGNGPAKTANQLLAYLKTNPAKATYGSSGMGSTSHLGGELLQHVTGLPMIHVPYKGVTEALHDMLGGRITFIFAGMGQVMPLMKSGNLRILGIANTSRHELLPDVQTMAEAGLNEFDLPGIAHALVGPPKMQREVVTRLNQNLRTVLADPEIKAQISKQGYDSGYTTPEELGEQLRKESDAWGRITAAAKIEKE